MNYTDKLDDTETFLRDYTSNPYIGMGENGFTRTVQCLIDVVREMAEEIDRLSASAAAEVGFVAVSQAVSADMTAYQEMLALALYLAMVACDVDMSISTKARERIEDIEARRMEGWTTNEL